MNNLDAFVDIINNDNFIVTSHVNPDGDNIGSSVGMVRFLKNMGKKVVHILEDDIPSNLNFLIKDYKVISKDTADYVQKNFGEYYVIAIDCADISRLAISKEIVDKAKSVVNIDHHVSNTRFGNINIVDSDISSSCELVTNILRKINESQIDSDIATALLTGILTDTGNLLFPAVTEDTFATAGFLVGKNANKDLITNELYRNVSYNQRKLYSLVVSTLEIDNGVGFIHSTTKMLEESGVDYKDIDYLTNIPIDTQGVDIGIFIKQIGDNLYKVSLRSKDKINVCEMAQKFGGGGHFNASGLTISGELSDIKSKLYKEAINQIKKDK